MYKNKRVIALIVAGGRGSRMGGSMPKQYMFINDAPILQKTIERFERNHIIDEIIVVVNKEDIEHTKLNITYDKPKITKVIKGGENRTESVYNGLFAIETDEDEKNVLVLIHDGVRPFVSKNTIDSCVELTSIHGATIPIIEVKDTIKQINETGIVDKTVSRELLRAVQTPQGFKLNIIKKCYEKALKDGLTVTDDSSIVEHYGYEVKTFQGTEKNIKITTPLDLKLAEIIARTV